jgi:proteasome accessory factor B
MSARKTERLLNLVICLLATSRYLTKAQIRRSVPQYSDCESNEAFERMFERDKDELREMGVPLVTGSLQPWPDDEIGYRIDRNRYALPEVTFAPDEMAVLGLAARVWQQASVAQAASYALLKLKASGVEPDESSLVGIEPQVRAAEPAFQPLWQALCARQPVTFPYRRSGADYAAERHVEPWGIVSRHGRWYLVGHDRDRAATRVFRLSRITGVVRPDGDPGTVQVPDGTDIRKQVMTFEPDVPQGLATVRVRSRAGHGLRRRAIGTEATEQGEDVEGWDLLHVRFWDEESFAEELTQYGDRVVIVEPASVREAVVRRLRTVAAVHAAASAGPSSHHSARTAQIHPQRSHHPRRHARSPGTEASGSPAAAPEVTAQ